MNIPIIYVQVDMATVAELKVEAEQFGLRGYSKLKKADLKKAVNKVWWSEYYSRFQRSKETGRLPPIHEDVKRRDKIRQIIAETTALLRAKTIA